MGKEVLKGWGSGSGNVIRQWPWPLLPFSTHFRNGLCQLTQLGTPQFQASFSSTSIPVGGNTGLGEG